MVAGDKCAVKGTCSQKFKWTPKRYFTMHVVSVFRQLPSWRWLMGRITIMLQKSNGKLRSRCKRGAAGGAKWWRREDVGGALDWSQLHAVHLTGLWVFLSPTLFLGFSCLFLEAVSFSMATYCGWGRPRFVLIADLVFKTDKLGFGGGGGGIKNKKDWNTFCVLKLIKPIEQPYCYLKKKKSHLWIKDNAFIYQLCKNPFSEAPLFFPREAKVF